MQTSVCVGEKRRRLQFRTRRKSRIGRGVRDVGRHADDNQLDLQGDHRPPPESGVGDGRREGRSERPVAEHDLLARYFSRIRKEGRERKKERDVRERLERLRRACE